MHKIDHATATLTKEFTEGDPQGGVKPTVVTSDWLNSIQNELANLITAMGLTLNKADNTQLTQALTLLKTVSSEKFTIANSQSNTLLGSAFEFDLTKIRSVLIECSIYRKDASQEVCSAGNIIINAKEIDQSFDVIQNLSDDEKVGVVFGISKVGDIGKLVYSSSNFIGANYFGEMIFKITLFKR